MLACKCSQLFLSLKKRNNFFFNFFICCIGKIYKIISFFYWQKKSSSCRTRSTKTSGSRIWKFRNFLKKLELASQILFGLFVYYFDFNVFRTKVSKNNGYITAIFWIYNSPTNKYWYERQTRPRVYPTAQLLGKYKTDVERYLFRFS